MERSCALFSGHLSLDFFAAYLLGLSLNRASGALLGFSSQVLAVSVSVSVSVESGKYDAAVVLCVAQLAGRRRISGEHICLGRSF